MQGDPLCTPHTDANIETGMKPSTCLHRHGSSVSQPKHQSCQGHCAYCLGMGTRTQAPLFPGVTLLLSDGQPHAPVGEPSPRWPGAEGRGRCHVPAPPPFSHKKQQAARGGCLSARTPPAHSRQEVAVKSYQLAGTFASSAKRALSRLQQNAL